MTDQPRPREQGTAPLPAVAVSACLTGQRVRYDGTHKCQEQLLAHLPGRLRLVPVCPEVAAGLPTPRPPVELVVGPGGTRVLGRDDPGVDVTAVLRATACSTLEALLREHPLCGWIWQSRSPSCGLGSTPRRDTSGRPLPPGNGIQADHVVRRAPWLLCVEADALAGPAACLRYAHCCELLFEAIYARRGEPLEALGEHYQNHCRQLPGDLRARLDQLLKMRRREHWAGLLARSLWCAPHQDSSSSQRA